MLNQNTQIIVDEFRKQEEFTKQAEKFLERAKKEGMTAKDREEFLAKSIEASCLLSMMKVRAPNFAHEIIVKAFDGIDWRAAARALYLVQPEAN